MEFLKPKLTPKKNIAYKVLSVLVDYDVDLKEYNDAIEDFNEMGGIDGISQIMEWDENQKKNWINRIENVYNIK